MTDTTPTSQPLAVIKRDGRTAAFDSAKIASAIARAGAATREFGAERADALAAAVAGRLANRVTGVEQTGNLAGETHGAVIRYRDTRIRPDRGHGLVSGQVRGRLGARHRGARPARTLAADQIRRVDGVEALPVVSGTCMTH